jgi:type II secretory pathway pseudopilin PulG
MRAIASKHRGFTYIGLLFAVVVLGLMLTVIGRVWRTTVQREREAQLLWVGHAYRTAIASYYAYGHRFPTTLQDLITDERSPVPKHHLRRLYPDPITGAADWTLILTPNQTGILGVASSSQVAPIKRDGFDLIDALFKDAEHYSDWKFVYTGNRWGVAGSVPGTPIGPPEQPGPPPDSQPPGPTTAPGVPLPPLNDNPSPPLSSAPPNSGSN